MQFRWMLNISLAILIFDSSIGHFKDNIWQPRLKIEFKLGKNKIDYVAKG